MAARMTLPSAGSAQDGDGEAGRRRSMRRWTIRRWLLAVALVTLAVVAAAGVYADLSSRDTAVTDPLVDRADKPAPPFSLPEC